ncbi:MAG: dipeptide epimerase [Candidatus Omnitrophota bacterium]|nr:dipeptide epimerase [Candidatus Omnitrophota bacterium]
MGLWMKFPDGYGVGPMPEISKIEIFKTNLPFKHSFKHSLKSRNDSESIFVKVILDNGITGFGESLPRSYVTGNTQDSVFKNLSDSAGKLIGTRLDDNIESINFIKSLEGLEGEARCAVEIALLDSLGKICSKPVSAFLADVVNTKFVYSMIIPTVSAFKTGLICLFAKVQGYEFIKVKVGADTDVQRVKLCRKILPKADIRIDANGVWDSAKTALGMIQRLRPFKISCIEQPTPKDDLEAMQEVADFCAEPVMADESLCTRQDALKLAQSRVCDMFNVRLSKCGGIFRSLDIMDIARNHEMSCQIGCLVGESGILSAAGRHIASVAKNIVYFEGSYSRFLLKEDIVEEDLTPARSVGYTLKGAGLGVTVKEDILRKYSKESLLIGQK